METMKIQDLFLLEVFIKANQLQSFSKAANKLGLTSSVVSKKISQLEANLGVTLFHRTTRKISLTEDGRKLLRSSEHIIEEVKAIEDSFDAESTSNELQGTIRLSSAETYANARLVGVISKFCQLYPEITIDLVLSNSFLSLADENIDVAIRIYKPTDSSLKAFKIEHNDLVFCASPNYLKKHKTIKTLNELKKHRLMLLKAHGKEKTLKSGKMIKSIFNTSSLNVNSGETINQFCINAHGIALRSKWDIERYIKEGKLVEIKINDSVQSKTGVYVVFQEGMYLPKRVRIFLDFLKNNIG